MNPKSEKPLRLFNPLSIWTDFALKSGQAILASAQAVVAGRPAPKVGVIHAADAPPPPKARPAKGPKAKGKKRRTKRAKR